MPPLRTIAKFGVVGVCATLSYLWLNIYALRALTESAPAVGNALAQGLSMAVSYLGHKFFTFESDASHGRDIFRFLVASAVAVAICSGAFHVMMAAGAGVVIASLVVAVAYPAVSFVLHFSWTFKPPTPSTPP